MFIFFNSTFLPLFAVGMLGQPRRVFEYAANLQTLNDWVSISAFSVLFAVGFLGRPVQLVRGLGGLLGHGYASTPALAVPALA